MAEDIARLGLYVDSSGVVRATKDLNKLEREGKQAERQSDKLKRSFGGLKTAAIALGGAIAAIGVSRLVGGVADAGIALDAINSSLRVATGSAEGAAAEFEFLRQESERLGLDLRESAGAFASLAAAAKGTALEGEETREIFIAVSEAMTALGRSSAETEGALTAIEQIISKGKVSAEELRGQLGERLPGAFQIAARSIGVTTQELDKMLSNGELLAEDLLPALADELRNTFSAEAEARANGLQAELNRFKTAVFELMSSGNMDGLANAVRDITTLVKDPGFQQGFSSFVGGVIQLAEWGAKAASGMAQLGQFMGENLARNLYGPLLDTPEEVQKAINDVESQLDALDAEIEKHRLLRINPFKSDEELLADYNELTNKLATLQALKEGLERTPVTPVNTGNAGGTGAVVTGGGLSPVVTPTIARPKQEDIDTGSLWWDWATEAAEEAMIDTQAILDAWSPRLFEDFPDEAEKASGEMTVFMEEFAKNTQNLLADNLFNFMQGEFELTADSFKRMLDRMVADAIAADLASKIFDNEKTGEKGWLSKGVDFLSKLDFGGGSDLGADFAEGLPSSIPSFDGGGYTGSGSRLGGIDGKGGQLAILHPQETVVDHTKGQSTQNITLSPVYHINSNNPQQVRATVDQAHKQLLRQLQHAQRNM